MDILVVEDSQTDALALQRIVSALGYEVRTARTGNEAKAQFAKQMPDVVLMDWMLPDVNGEALTKLVRQHDSDKYTYVVFVTSKAGVDNMRSAFAAGADDYVQKPIHRDELAARLRAAERIVQLETRLRQRVLELESALRRLDVNAAALGARVAASNTTAGAPVAVDDAVLEPLTELATWSRLPEIARLSVSELLQGEFRLADPSGTPVEFDARILLTNVALGLQLVLSVAVPRRTAEVFAERLFGAADDDAMLQDLLGEVSNTCMGAVKAAFSGEGSAWTAGIPISGRGESSAWLAENCRYSRSYGIADDDASLTFGVGVRERPTSDRKVKELGEGMVLAKDVKDDLGRLLVASGTRITATLAERLRRVAPNTTVCIIDDAQG
ncbi:MAG: response regulator [Polyangiaceae bacterium]